MTGTFLSVETEGLQEAIDNATNIDWQELTSALAEGVTEFKSRMTTGPGKWHKGYRVRRKDGMGLSSYYVKPDHPGAKLSGRSNRGWKVRQRGISAVVFNDARDKIGGTFYAQYVRRPGEKAPPSGELGPEAERALGVFEEEMQKVAQNMIASLTEQISGS